MKSILLSILLLFSLSAASTTLSQKGVDVIYGQDNRQDFYEVSNQMYKDLSLSTAAMISHGHIQNYGVNNYRISAATMAQRGICSTERFANQPTAGNCSGFLIGEKLLATAGHCIRSMNDCKSYSWVFDYKTLSPLQKEYIVPKDSVYKCKSIVRRDLDSGTMNDFAIVELDRKVNKPILKLRSEGSIQVGDPLVVIGHPTGLPTKIADGANVRELKGVYFKANLDTYGGNSGSAVFNAKTGLVEGILVRGERDFVRSPTGCMISNRCSDSGCRGEDVTYASQLQTLLEEYTKGK